MDKKWMDFERECVACQKCSLGLHRTQPVIYRGSLKAPLLILGEAPGANEDKIGRPFVGQSGKLLDRLLETNHIQDSFYHIANMVKCRPAKNRTPLASEVQACKPLLLKQIEMVQPQIVLLLGSTATGYFLQTKEPISILRGNVLVEGNLRIVPTYHPAYALYSRSNLVFLEKDIQLVKELLWSIL